MPYEFAWHDDAHTIIRIEIYEDVTWEGYLAVHELIYEELERASHRIDLIFSDRAGLPPGNGFRYLSYASDRLLSYPTLGKIYSALLKDGLFVEAMIDTTLKIYRLNTPRNGGFVSSVEEAEALIYKDRAEAAQS